MLEIGSVIDGKYKILNVIGKGGMSVVYLALNERANKTWAIKEVRKDGKQDFEVVKQGLVVETEMLKKLHHPNLPSIVDVLDGDDSFLIVMDYIEGAPLSSYVKKGPLPQENVIAWAKQLCDVLEYLHTRKPPIIYRDMKPANVMLRPDGSVTLIDFGIAREYKEGNVADTSVLGTRGYAAPEQYGGRGQTDARTDIYCLGATMYHLLTGHNPSEYPYEMYPIRQWNPQLSSGLEEIILKCTESRPEDRYQSCAELYYALEHYDELDIEYRKKQGRKWTAFLATSVVTLVAGIGAIGCYAMESRVTSTTYDAYMADAAGSVDQEEKVENYISAIKLNPSKGEAYVGMLDTMVNYDGNFSSEEEEQVRSILNYSGDTNRTNVEYLSQNTDDYNKVAYELGVSYFYSYNETGNKSASTKWLGIASEAESSDELSQVEIDRAKKLYKIAGYHDRMRVQKKTGDSLVSYKDFWQDLIDISDGNLVATDNNVTAMIMYKELTYQIFDNAKNFMQAGVSQEEMEEQVEKAEEAITQISIDTDNKQYETGLQQAVENNIVKARESIRAAFSVVGTSQAEEVEEDGTGTAAD